MKKYLVFCSLLASTFITGLFWFLAVTERRVSMPVFVLAFLTLWFALSFSALAAQVLGSDRHG